MSQQKAALKKGLALEAHCKASAGDHLLTTNSERGHCSVQ
ncbi:hypothetical protein RIEGSTA812A_PEG_849 [invertebrate metagenome]|uniref:Uncharacterized protein n=1 Tax=invertebrate metagenome TaxID=1711999 RepID=A0A484H5Q2_9ZZZZ